MIYGEYYFVEDLFFFHKVFQVYNQVLFSFILVGLIGFLRGYALFVIAISRALSGRNLIFGMVRSSMW